MFFTMSEISFNEVTEIFCPGPGYIYFDIPYLLADCILAVTDADVSILLNSALANATLFYSSWGSEIPRSPKS